MLDRLPQRFQIVPDVVSFADRTNRRQIGASARRTGSCRKVTNPPNGRRPAGRFGPMMDLRIWFRPPWSYAGKQRAIQNVNVSSSAIMTTGCPPDDIFTA